MKVPPLTLVFTLFIGGCEQSLKNSDAVDLKETTQNKNYIESAIDWTKLQNRAGVTFIPNTEKPFNGWGKITYENDQVGVLAQFEDGFVLRLKQWEKNGIPKWDIGYTSGKVSLGDVPIDNLSESNQSHHNGLTTTWHKNGQKHGEINYKNGHLDGLSPWWHENGQLILKENWENDKLMSKEVWKPDGKKCPETNLTNGNGVVIIYNNNGYKTLRENYTDGKKEGLLTSWYQSGEKRFEESYKNGKLDGLRTEWYENGQKKNVTSWKNGEADGRTTVWYENGQKSKEMNFKNNKLDGLSTVWEESGVKTLESLYEDGKEVKD